MSEETEETLDELLDQLRKLTEGTSLIHTNEGMVDVKSYKCASVPGLIIHRSFKNDSEWTISHERSGFSISMRNIPTKKLAVQIAEALGQLADWTRTEEELTIGYVEVIDGAPRKHDAVSMNDVREVYDRFDVKAD